MPKYKPRYTADEARGRIPELAKSVMLSSRDLLAALEQYPVTSREVEIVLWQLSGQLGLLSRMFHIVWKYEGFRKTLEEATAKRSPSDKVTKLNKGKGLRALLRREK